MSPVTRYQICSSQTLIDVAECSKDNFGAKIYLLQFVDKVTTLSWAVIFQQRDVPPSAFRLLLCGSLGVLAGITDMQQFQHPHTWKMNQFNPTAKRVLNYPPNQNYDRPNPGWLKSNGILSWCSSPSSLQVCHVDDTASSIDSRTTCHTLTTNFIHLFQLHNVTSVVCRACPTEGNSITLFAGGALDGIVIPITEGRAYLRCPFSF